jgi:hypothetical protein
MNKDTKLIFEAYFNKSANLINELDVGADFAGGALGPIKKGIKSAPGKGYLVDLISKGLNISHEDAVEMLGKRVFDKVFRQKAVTIDGKEYPFSNDAKNEDQFRTIVKNAVAVAVQEIQKENPSLKLPGSDAIKGYTARVISNLGGFAKDFQKGKFGATKDSVKQIEKAVTAADKSTKITAKPETPAVDDTIETYEKDEFPTKVPDYRKVFDALGDSFTIKKGQDLYDTPEFRSSVEDAVESVYGSKDQGEIKDFIDTMKFYRDKNKINPYAIAGSGEGVPDEAADEPTPEDILKDLGAIGRGGGFDEYDKYSSN